MVRQRALRLDGHIGWRCGSTGGLALGHEAITLAPLPGTIRPIAAPDGSFGGLSAPVRVATGADGLLFLIDAAGLILRYDSCQERFHPIPCLQQSRPPHGLRNPIAIAVRNDAELLILDGETRSISAFAIHKGRVRQSWGPFVAHENILQSKRLAYASDPETHVPTDTILLPDGCWDPRDIAVLPDGCIAISDAGSDRIHLFDHRGIHKKSLDGSADDGSPLAAIGALGVLPDGRIAVVEEQLATIAILDPQTNSAERTEQIQALVDDGSGGAIAVDADGAIWISNRERIATSIVRRDGAGRCLSPEPVALFPVDCAVLAFDSDGYPLLGDARNPCPQRTETIRYAAKGELLSQAYDSGRAGTIWDDIKLEGRTPQGTLLRVETLTSNVDLDAAAVSASPPIDWSHTVATLVEGEKWVAAIRSRPGRYLWLRLTFSGDGAATPEIHSIGINWPRNSSMRYLPGCFAADTASADFLSRFLGLFDQMREDALAPVDSLPAYFDAMATPAAEPGEPGLDFLDWLGGWIGLALDRNWSVARRRRLVAEAPKLFRLRGTVEGLKRHIAIYTGAEPHIVEHFKLRRWVALDDARLDDHAALWGEDIVKRLQLDAYSEIGRFALIDGGDPLTDPVAAFAHRASLYVVVDNSFSESDRAAIEAVAEMAKPAHVELDIRLMKPRFVVGCEMLLGVNTVLGCPPEPARIDQSIFGEDIRLGGPPAPFTLNPGLRLGVDTTLE